jgi:hypothetical protein
MDTNFLGGAIHKYEQKDNDDDGADKVVAKCIFGGIGEDL